MPNCGSHRGITWTRHRRMIPARAAIETVLRRGLRRGHAVPGEDLQLLPARMEVAVRRGDVHRARSGAERAGARVFRRRVGRADADRLLRGEQGAQLHRRGVRGAVEVDRRFAAVERGLRARVHVVDLQHQLFAGPAPRRRSSPASPRAGVSSSIPLPSKPLPPLLRQPAPDPLAMTSATAPRIAAPFVIRRSGRSAGSR